MNASSNVVLTNLNASTCVRRPQDLDSCPGVRKLLTRRPDERVGPMPAYLKEQFLEGQKNACQILQEYCQIRRLTLSYEEVNPPDIPGIEVCWWMRVVINQVTFPRAAGKNKKIAKQEAAESALMRLFDIEPVLSTLMNESAMGSVVETREGHDESMNFLEELKSIVPEARVEDKVQKFLDSNDFSANRTKLMGSTLVKAPVKALVTGSNWDDSDDEEKSAVKSCKGDTSSVISPSPIYQADGIVMQKTSSINVMFERNLDYQNLPFSALILVMFQTILMNILEKIKTESVVNQLSGDYAAIMVQKEPRDIDVVAIGSGRGHLDSNEWPPIYLGTVLHDCHSIVIARRSFLRYLYIELTKHLEGIEPQDSIFKPKPDENGRWSLKDSVTFHAMMSRAPCGAAASEQSSAAEIKEESLISHSSSPDRKLSRSERLRILLEKGNGKRSQKAPSVFEEDITFKSGDSKTNLKSLSCSDKILRWNYLGWEGSLLGCFINPIFMSSIHFGEEFVSEEKLKRSLVKRSFQSITSEIVQYIPMQFRNAPVLQLNRINSEDSILNAADPNVWRRNDSTAALSLNWCFHDHLPELIEPLRGQVSHLSPFKLPAFKGQSRLCKKAFLSRFTKHTQLLQSSKVPDSYRGAKKIALAAFGHYAIARKGFIASFEPSQGVILQQTQEKKLFVNF